MELLTCTVFGVFILLSFVLGLHFGTKIRDNKPIITNPIETIKENKIIREEKREKEKEQLIEEINLANIDAYDGTSLGQQDFPR